MFLLGHSMGGQIALAYALDHQDDLRGLVLSAPALASNAVPKAAVPVLRALARVAPTLRPAGIDVTKISKDPAVVRRLPGRSAGAPRQPDPRPLLGPVRGRSTCCPNGPASCGFRC